MRESRTVLLAFSDEKLLDGLESTLKGNYRIEKAMTCQEVRQSLPEIQPEVVLLEERLDNGKGVKLALELFSENPALQLILFSQETSKLNTRQALALGLADWLRLPAKPNTVREAVKQCFARRDRWRKWHQQEEKKVTGRLVQRVDELEMIFHVGRTITSQLDLDRVLTEIVDAAVQIAEAEEGSILLPDDETGELYMVAARNFQEEFVRTFRLPVEDTHAGQVLRTGEPFFLNEVDPQKIKTSYLVFSAAYVPLIYHGRTIGVLSVDNRESKRMLAEENITLLSTMADYAAVAIENAKLFLQTDRERIKLETILEQIEDGVLVVAENGEILLVNHVVRELFDLEDAEIAGKMYHEVFTHRDLLMAIRGGFPYPERIEILVDEGTYYRVRITMVDGIGKVLSLHDISYLKKLNEVKTEFVNNVSHDLRTPLTSIMGYVELLKRVGDVNEKQTEFIERIQSSIRQIISLIQELLQLGKIESQLDANFRIVSLPPVIEEVMTGFKPAAAEKSQILTFSRDDGVPSVYGDSMQLRQLFQNLIGNAIKYTGQGGEIVVEIGQEKEQVIVRVRDNGRGIPLEDQSKIFERFYRSKNVSADVEGTGLGLSITKAIVDNHRGRIWVDSKLGEGSVFSVVLPIYLAME
jgi:two-component system NtrC family sensor kinase